MERVEVLIKPGDYVANKVTDVVNSMANVGYLLISTGSNPDYKGLVAEYKLIFQRDSYGPH